MMNKSQRVCQRVNFRKHPFPGHLEEACFYMLLSASPTNEDSPAGDSVPGEIISEEDVDGEAKREPVSSLTCRLQVAAVSSQILSSFGFLAVYCLTLTRGKLMEML